MNMQRGRPTVMTPEVVETICNRLINGETLNKICADSDMPHKSTVLRMTASTDEKTKAFRDQYAQARQAQAEGMYDDLLTICDDDSNDYEDGEDGKKKINQENIQRDRLRVDTRKFILVKVLPKFAERMLHGIDQETVPSGPASEFLKRLGGNNVFNAGSSNDTGGKTTKKKAGKRSKKKATTRSSKAKKGTA